MPDPSLQVLPTPLGWKLRREEEGKQDKRKRTANHAVIMLPGDAGRELNSQR